MWRIDWKKRNGVIVEHNTGIYGVEEKAMGFDFLLKIGVFILPKEEIIVSNK